jgi:hypothetical protein
MANVAVEHGLVPLLNRTNRSGVGHFLILSSVLRFGGIVIAFQNDDDNDYLEMFGPSWDKLSKFEQQILLAVVDTKGDLDDVWDLLMDARHTKALAKQKDVFMNCFTHFTAWRDDLL